MKELRKTKGKVASFIATSVGKLILLTLMYNALKGLYISNEYLAIIMTIVMMWRIKDFYIELEYK